MLGETSPFQRFTNHRHDKLVYVSSYATYLQYISCREQMSDRHSRAQWSSGFYDNNLLCTESIMIVSLSIVLSEH